MNSAAVGTGVGVMGAARNHIDTDLNGASYQMKDNTRQTTNNVHGHNGQMPAGNYLQCNTATTSLPGSIAVDPDNVWNASTQAPAVDGQVYSALCYDWWLQVFNRNGYDGLGASMLTVVNYSAEGDNNAYWDGQRIVIWSFSSGWRSLAGCPDVIAHEWGHAITEHESGLVYEKEPGALNESFSDMMGAAFEWAHDTMDVPDWGMGENGRTTGVPFRSMSDPHLYSNPDYYGPSDPYWTDVVNCSPSPWNDYCGVHNNSGVGNKWYYLLSDGGLFHGVSVSGIGPANAILIAYRANAFYWTSSTDYHQAALGTLSAANDLNPGGAWTNSVANAWNAVGVSTPGPSLAFSYPSGVPSIVTPNQTTPVSVLVTGTLGGVPVAGSGRIHYSIDGDAYVNDVMTEGLPGHYTATLPALSCNSRINFYFSANEVTSGIKYDPDPLQPFSAISAASSVTAFSDNFEEATGWTVSSTATNGIWERGIPAGGGSRGDPTSDYDASGQCYLTGNAGGDSDVDGGATTLYSPVLDLSAAGLAKISYARWYSNSFGAAPYEDTFKIYISNDGGASWVLVETVGPTDQASGGWNVHTFWVNDFVTPTSQIKMRFLADDLGAGSVVEAAIDAFTVTAYQCGSSLQITTNSLPDWTIGVPYSQQLVASGGTGILTWSDFSGTLVGTGLSLSSTGLLSGTPSGTGTITFTAKVIDEASGSSQKPLTFHINPAVSITSSSVPDWTVGRPYSQQLLATGGTGTRVWTDLNGNLVGTGLTLSTAGSLSGTPSVSGQISFTAQVSDQVGDVKTRVFSFMLNPAITVSTASIPDSKQNRIYYAQLACDGGTGAKTWSDKNNNLAGTGLTLSSSGLISGTPPTLGAINFTARVVDATGSAGEKLFSIHVYVCGDADGGYSIDISDAVYVIGYIFAGGPAPVPLLAGDADCSGNIDISDAVYLITYIFGGGLAPCGTCK